MYSHSLINLLCVLTIFVCVKVVRTQDAQDPIKLTLTPAVLNPIANSDPVAIFPTSITGFNSTTSPFSPTSSENSVAQQENHADDGLSVGAIVGIIIGVAVFLIGCILIYQWSNKPKNPKAGSEDNPLLSRIKEMREAALKSKESIKRSISSRANPTQSMQKVNPPQMQEQRSIDVSKHPVEGKMMQKQVGLTQPSLYAEEHEILDSMDLPILPANLSASERVRIIIDTLRKSRGPKSRPSTPMAKPAPSSETRVNIKMETRDLASNAPSIPSVPIPFITSVPPPGYKKSVTDGYRPIKPHTRPNKKNSICFERTPLIGSDIINMENPFKEDIDNKVSSMIENVLNHEISKK